MLLAAVAALACLGCAAGAPAATPINDSAELFAALAALPGTGNSTLVLQQNVALSAADGAGYQLPFSISSGETVRLQGAAGTPLPSLEFGIIPLLLNILTGGSLVLENLNISGTASQESAPPGTNTTIQLLAVWPTITGEPGAAIEMRDVNITLHPSPRCSAETIQNAVQQLKLAAQPGSDVATSDGLTGRFVNFVLPIPILNASGGAEGALAFRAVDTNITCQPEEAPSPAPTPVPADGDGGGGGLSGGAIAGIAIGAAAGAALLACAAWWMMLRRRRGGKGSGAGRLDEEAAKRAGEPDMMTGSKEELKSSPGSTGSLLKEQLGPSSIASAATAREGSLGSRAGSGTLQPRGSLFQSRVGAIEGLHLGGILGRGAFGHVYKGRWKGTQVAVKIVPMQVAAGEVVDLEHEPLLSLSLSHPNVLAAYKMCVVRLQRDGEGGSGDATGEGGGPGGPASPGAASPRERPAAAEQQGSAIPGASGSSGSGARQTRSAATSSTGGSMLGSGSTGPVPGQLVPSLTDKSTLVEVMPPQALLEPGLYETWLVSELADGGSLADAILKGRFANDLEGALLCLLDIARGLEYLHSSNILHGDLKPQNVLLRSVRSDRRGFVCKLCDFGLSRLLSDHQTSLLTAHFGTVSHAAPELLQHGRLTRSSDVYAFGVVMWEIVSGQRPFKGMSPMQIICLTTQDGYRLPIPEHCPPQLDALMQRCWDGDPRSRPTAAAIVEELIQIGARLSRAPHAP